MKNRFGRQGIKNLMLYVTILNGIVFILSYIDPQGLFLSKLVLVPSLVQKGEVWRLVTFLFIPPTTSPMWVLFTLYFYYMIGSTLENEWGSFKFTVYYIVGALGTIVAAFLVGGVLTGAYLNLSLIFAFAYMYPNYQLLIFFFIPVKIKYLAIFYAVTLVLSFWSSPIIGLITIGSSVLNFILFFGKDIILGLKTGRKAYYNRRSFESKIPKVIIMHRCSVCGRTERDDKNLEFRYCVDCDGDYEYCMEHLYQHEHIKGDNRLS